MAKGKRQIVIYSNDAEAPANVREGEVLPAVRGDGPREGDFMGWATVHLSDGGLDLKLTQERPEGAS